MSTFHAPARPINAKSGDERRQLDGWLDFYRATLLTKCDGLSEDEMTTRPVTSSSLSLLGLVRHMTVVETYWFQNVLLGEDTVSPFHGRDENGDAIADDDFVNLASHSLDAVVALYDAATVASTRAASGHALGDVAVRGRHGEPVDLRWIYLHMIEEYARHCGHADIVRELLDGVTGY